MSYELTPVPVVDFRYATIADMIAVFGTKTLVEWTNLNPKATTVDTDRLTLALADAHEEVDRRLGNSPYTVPLIGMTTEDAGMIRDLACKLAMVWLYDHRPGIAIDEEGRPKHQGRAMRKDCDRKFMNVIAGQYVLSASRRVGTPSVSGYVPPI